MFQFQLVRLKLDGLEIADQEPIKFQFQLVRLKRKGLFVCNSKKQVSIPIGSIKTARSCPSPDVSHVFQFQLVRLKLLMKVLVILVIMRFNSNWFD